MALRTPKTRWYHTLHHLSFDGSILSCWASSAHEVIPFWNADTPSGRMASQSRRWPMEDCCKSTDQIGVQLTTGKGPSDAEIQTASLIIPGAAEIIENYFYHMLCYFIPIYIVDLAIRATRVRSGQVQSAPLAPAYLRTVPYHLFLYSRCIYALS